MDLKEFNQRGRGLSASYENSSLIIMRGKRNLITLTDHLSGNLALYPRLSAYHKFVIRKLVEEYDPMAGSILKGLSLIPEGFTVGGDGNEVFYSKKRKTVLCVELEGEGVTFDVTLKNIPPEDVELIFAFIANFGMSIHEK
jgi:hypothetical protein